MDRILLYQIPRGGIPEENVPEGAIIAARVPIYGTRDAGRGFWLELKDVSIKKGLKLNRILPTVFSLVDDTGEIIAVMSSNVDDLLYGFKPEAEHVFAELLAHFQVGTDQVSEFRFCGKEVKQHPDFGISVTCKDNTEKIKPVHYDKCRRLTTQCSDDEISQMRSVVQALAWIARLTRPDLSYRVSRLQTLISKATVKDLRETNRVLEYAQLHSTKGIYFSPDGPSWKDAVVATISDACFCHEVEDIGCCLEENRSQHTDG